MFKVVLIDDDPLTVMGMKSFIRWEEYDFVIAGDAHDGLAGLKVCREVKPDLAIIDMKMPGLTGIELIRHINAELSGTEVIILSAYGEFELARQAIKLNVYDYLLKPIQRKQFIDIIEKVSDKLKKAKKEDEALYQEDESRKLIKDIKKFIHQNLHKEISLQHIAEEFSLNEYYISHLFKRETGINFLYFITNEKMEKARDLLGQPSLRINEVAEMVGYSDQRYFSQVFKKYIGCTPREYREKRG